MTATAENESHEDNLESIISDGLSAVTEGCRLPVNMRGTDDNVLAEVLAIRYVYHVR